jgi:hypothetical protein
MWKLVSVEPSPIALKKYRAYFFNSETNKKKHTDFGATGYTDFIKSGGDLELREKYRKRHKKDLETGDPTRAGFLSYYVLWNKKTLSASIADYKNMFNM